MSPNNYIFALGLALVAIALCLMPTCLVAATVADSNVSHVEALNQPVNVAAELVALVSLLGLGIGMALSTKDKSLENTKALPASATTVAGDGFNLGHGSRGDFTAQCELEIEAPVLTTGELPDSQTMIYHVYHATASDYSNEALLYGNVITQTGAGGAGAAAQTKQVRLPLDVNPYVRVKAVKSGAGSAAAKSMTTRLVF
ncbi:hypothetical protein C5Y96_05705 [Blastopirellula marina]|uniref:Uncharacterized protein n=1 Tax=Blastopirellula marina TaxID=124 RepID=A0A2S8G4G8_9BACT|nr:MULTISPECIES: hypothetical protein [Pirellulaceae]PQO39349.1 hypothetical protein C5Y96_05705 [Blastopirellula marina]RCS55657.1 hypothetical protein DTL36_05715 [Bremerella cremea]